MKDDTEYEILPHTELDYLRHEVEKLKRNPLGDAQASMSLLDAMNKLNMNVVKLVEIFTSANEEMVRTFHETSTQEQIRKMLEQNEKLAKGIVAVAELVKDLENKIEEKGVKVSAEPGTLNQEQQNPMYRQGPIPPPDVPLPPRY